MTTLINRVVGVAGVCSYACNFGMFRYAPDIAHADFRKNISAGSSGNILQKLGITLKVIFM